MNTYITHGDLYDGVVKLKWLGILGSIGYDFAISIDRRLKKLGYKRSLSKFLKDKVKEAVKFIKFYKDRGEKVYVHCKAGHGRAACVALCWMLSEDEELSPKEANADLCAKRKVRKTLYKQRNVEVFLSRLKVRLNSEKLETDK